MSQPLYPVVFQPSGRRGEFVEGTPLLDAARQLGVDIDSLCGGRGLCGRCQILCAEGEFPKHQIASTVGNLSAFTATEQKFEQRKGSLDGRRLSCHARIEGPLVIDVPPSSQIHRQVIKKDIDEREIELDPAVRLFYVEVPVATLDDARGDAERLLDALAEQWSRTGLRIDRSLLADLQRTLRADEWRVTAAIADDTVIALFPGLHESAYGLAVDVGSTTIAAHLCDLVSGRVVASSGLMNPQIRFGEDLMSRVSYVMMNPGGEEELTSAVREALSDVLLTACSQAQVPVDEVLAFVIVGNPIMHHLLLGIDPTELGGAPFALAVDSAVTLQARDLELPANPAAPVYLPPCIAGHVGADCAAAILAHPLYRQDPVTLLVDIGTNAEIVLGNKDRVLACSSPTGPAFEGAQISAGQRATLGAIERLRIDPQTREVRCKVIGVEPWSDEDGFAAAVAATGITGICGSGIIEAVGEMLLAGVISADGLMQGSLADVTPRMQPDGESHRFVLIAAQDGQPEIAVTQNDVRQIQLAKAALYAGVRLLMDAYPTDAVDQIQIAGAFGSNIDPKYAMLLGLIPDCALESVSAVGNAASTGARVALLNLDSRAEIESAVRRIEKIETAIADDFQEHFVAAMSIPHRSDPFDELFRVVARPAATTAPKRRRRRPRR